MKKTMRYTRKINLTVTLCEELEEDEEFWQGFQECLNDIKGMHEYMNLDNKHITNIIKWGYEDEYHDGDFTVDVDIKRHEEKLEEIPKEA